MKYILFITLCIICLQGFSEKVSREKAKKIAENWGILKMNKLGGDIVSELQFIHNKDTSLYIYNFRNEGFVIVPSDNNTCPILGYSNKTYFSFEKLRPNVRDLLGYYSDMVKFNKKEKLNRFIKDKWLELDEGITFRSVQASVPSLLETTNSARWAGWRPYFNQAPIAQLDFAEGYSGCVPGSMAEIMKYFKYPLIGTGTGTGYNNNVYFTQKMNCFFNYDIMPFRLTYCGNGANNCNDGSFDIIPGITQEQIDEVGKLQYMAGLAVEMHWLGNGDPTYVASGTYGNALNWVNGMANHFYYTTPTSTDFWDSSEIMNSTLGFKDALRNSLDSGNPALFKYQSSDAGAGHLIVIDGYENDEYFHCSMGWGGDQDAYYYLFSSDNDGIHLPRPQIELWGLNACLNIHPNCPPIENKTVTNIVVPNGGGELIQSGNDLTLNHITIQSGGRAVLRADHDIIISNDFEVALGGEILMVCQPCSN